MSETIYRKHRPKIFAEIHGQNHIKITLQNQIVNDKIAHAYLFCGIRGVGKTTIARIMAKALNCENREEAEPCNKCSSCIALNEFKSLDLIEIDAASNRGINEIRELREKVKYAPTKEKFKVFIIDEVHMLTTEAFNALLKTLEEPPSHAIFILITTEFHKIPDTIVSRCQRFDFKKLKSTEIISRLKNIIKKEDRRVDDKILQEISYRSGGSTRDAESLLGQVLSLGTAKITWEEASLVFPRSDFALIEKLIDLLIQKNTGEALALINKIVEEGVELNNFMDDAIEFLRKMMLAKVSEKLTTCSSLELPIESEKKIIETVKNIELSDLVLMTKMFLDKKKEMRYSDILWLHLELLAIEICQRGIQVDAPKPKNLDQQFKQVQQKQRIDSKDNVNEKAEEKMTGSIISANCKVSEVETKWPEIINSIIKVNTTLGSVMSMCKPLSLEDGVLQLGFKYKLHQDRADSVEMKKILEETLSKHLGGQVRVKSRLAEIDIEKKIDKDGMDDESMNGLIQAFGTDG